MELNALQIRLAQIYEGGIYAPGRILEDAQNRNDALFLFLLQEAETCSDTVDLMGRLAVTIDRLQDVLEALETPANDGVEEAESEEGDKPDED